MLPVFLAQWMKEKRSPYMVLIFTGLSIAAALLFGSNIDSAIKIDVFRAEGVSEADAGIWLERLNESGAFVFQLQDEEQSLSDVRQGRSDMAVKLLDNDYRIIAAIDNANIQLVEQHMQTIYTEELRINAAMQHADDEAAFRESMTAYLKQPPLTLQSTTSEGEEIRGYDMGLQLMFGFSLFLVMFTVGFKINAITTEKVTGLWNRVILSPVTKSEMYLGHLTYSSLIGIVQIAVIFLLFQYVFGYNLGNNAGMLAVIIIIYIVAIAAMSILFTGLLRTPEQFTTIFTSVVPIMPLISGVYMPPGLITNKILLFIAQFFPLQHAMDALIGATIYGQGWSELMLPLAKLLLMGVIFFGVGINMVERRKI